MSSKRVVSKLDPNRVKRAQTTRNCWQLMMQPLMQPRGWETGVLVLAPMCSKFGWAHSSGVESLGGERKAHRQAGFAWNCEGAVSG
jgi:hypothetical protein